MSEQWKEAPTMLNFQSTIITPAISLILVASAVSADTRIVHCPLGCPANPADNDLVVYHLFALSNDPRTRFADWVAYEVSVTNFGVSPGRNFKADPMLLDDETLEPNDYKGANKDPDLQADKGHQAPLASFAGSPYWYETNYLSNITPQDKDLNQGPWRVLEDAVRKATVYGDSVYVITGPTYSGTVRSLPQADEPNDVPDGYFKIVYSGDGKAVGFHMNQSIARSVDYCTTQMPLAEIQQMLDFALPELTDSSVAKRRLGCD